MVLNKIKSLVQSKWSMPALFAFAVFFWAIDFVGITVCVFAIYVCFVFFFCEDVKVAFAPILYIHFFVQYIFYSVANWVVYGSCIGIVVISIIYFVVKKLIESKKFKTPLKKGKLFWPLVVANIAYLLGGIIGNFNILTSVVVLGFCLVSYFFYWTSINFCKDLKKYLLYLFLCGAIFISVQLLFTHLSSDDIVLSIIQRRCYRIGSQNINVVALFLTMGMIASFAIGYKKKNDYLYFLLSLFFTLMVFFTYSRMMILLSFLPLIFFTIIMVKNSKNKRQFLITFILIFSILFLFCVIFIDNIYPLIESFIGRFTNNFNLGRSDLWTWCFEKFLQNPIFGYGFVTTENIPSLELETKVVMAHNTPLQFLTTLGIVGTVLICYFYFKKYQIMFKKYNKSNFFLIGIIILIELSGITDQAATMDIFIYIITLLLLSSIELNQKQSVYIAQKCCLCYGSNRAFSMVKDSANVRENIVLYKELLHNKRVVSELSNLGVSEYQNLTDFKSDDIAVIRAHGEPKSTFEFFENKGIKYLDCTCPNVKAINKLVQMKETEGKKIIIVGKYGKKNGEMHPEVLGTAGYCNKPLFVEDEEDAIKIDTHFESYYLVVQTTFSYSLAVEIIKILKEKFEKIGKQFEYKNTTCNAQKEINLSSVELAKEVDIMFVVGGKNSSNTKELFDNVSKHTKAYFVENINEVKDCLKEIKLSSKTKIGLTGGASTMIEELIEIKEYLENLMK
ncbi:MAG: hypothetical protein EOM55_00230 [Clostridia bacterium]|nr:hypothetical protein [Clostridia bacterium]